MTTASHITPANSESILTLCVDCGGGGIKTCVLDDGGFPRSDVVRTPVVYPFTPAALIEIIAERFTDVPAVNRITVGMPGMIRHGVVVYTPHYIRRNGPHSKLMPELAEAWDHLPIQLMLEERFEVPALVLNDAEVAAAGVVRGTGAELMLTLGTGLGTALIDNGRLAPHLEISHAPMRWGLTYDDVVGEHERLRLGDSAWSRRVLRAITLLEPVFRWDQLYLGGGNASRLTQSVKAKLPDVVFVSNTAGMMGGVRAWSMVAR